MTRTKQTARKRKTTDSKVAEGELVGQDAVPAKKKAGGKKLDAQQKKALQLEAKPIEDFEHVSSLKEMLEKLPPHGLAGVFKTLLHFYSQDGAVNVQYPKYTTDFHDGKWRTYTTTVNFKGQIFKCAGPMALPKQAEQSAAEVCLRSLGYLKAVTNDDDLVIQPYRGGSVGDNFVNRFESLMTTATKELGFKSPKYLMKTTEKEGGDYTSVLIFHGKKFEGESPESKTTSAKQKVVTSVLRWFGLNKFNQTYRMSKQFKLSIHKTSAPLSQYQSPMSLSPSMQQGWLNLQFLNNSLTMDGENGPEEARNSVFKILDESEPDLLNQLLEDEPSFNGKPFSSLERLSVGEIFSDDPNLLRIGNESFSIMMYCKDRKIHCQNRGKDVAIKPGHTIRGLKCSYKVAFPSLEVYVKAEHCIDLNFPNPPIPVVTKFKEIMMMHDHEADGKVHILLKRQVEERNFVKCAFKLKYYLKQLIDSDEENCSLDLEIFKNTIDAWSLKEVELLSQMTMESMAELFSCLFDYDDRCNEIFFSEELPADLKILKIMCQEELKNRKKKKGRVAKVETNPWLLPSISFQHRLTGVGVFTENQVFCLNRGIYEATGLKIKLNEIENSPHFDEPCNDNANPHRGDVCRYSIWCRCRKYSKGDQDLYHREELIAIEKTDENWVQTDRARQRQKKKEKLAANPKAAAKPGPKINPNANPWKVHIEAFNKVAEAKSENMEAEDSNQDVKNEKEDEVENKGEDENKNEGEVENKEGGENAGEDENEAGDKDRSKEDDEDKDDEQEEEEEEEVDQSSMPDYLERVHEECRWFTIEEAMKVSPDFASIATNETFTRELDKLRDEGEEFMNSKNQ